MVGDPLFPLWNRRQEHPALFCFPRHSAGFLQADGVGWVYSFSLKHSRTHFIAAGFSPKQKPRDVSHRANPRRECSLPQTFQLGSVRASLRILFSAAPGRGVTGSSLGSKNSPVPPTLQNKSFLVDKNWPRVTKADGCWAKLQQLGIRLRLYVCLWQNPKDTQLRSVTFPATSAVELVEDEH